MPASDPATFAAACISDLADACRPAMEELGREMQAEMRELISVPVQYVSPGSAVGPKPAPIGNRPGPGLVQRDARAPGIHFTRAGGKGVRVIRSKPGEPPRKEFGFLYKSMTTDTRVEGNRIITDMGSDPNVLTRGVKGRNVDYSFILEELMNRPHFRTIFARVQSYAVDRILSRLPRTI